MSVYWAPAVYCVLFEVLRILQGIKLTSLCFWRSLHSKGMMENNEVKLYKQDWLFVDCLTLCDLLDCRTPGQSPLSSPVSRNLLKLMSIESVILSNYLILCCSFLLLPSIFPRIWVLFFFPQWVGFLHQVAKVLELQLQHQSFQRILRVDFL